MSLVAVGVVASLSVGYLHLSASVTRRQVGASDTKMAFYLAEAGLAEAYSGIMIGHTGAIGSEAEPAVLGDGLLWVEATALDDDHVQLESVGMAHSGQARLGLVIRRGRANVGGLGIFSETDVTVGAGSLLDGYDSTDGDYATQAAADPDSVRKGSLGSNGDITISSGLLSPTNIHGDVHPGPAGALTLVGGPTITGTSDPSFSLVTLDPVVVPEVPLAAGVVHPAGAPLVVPSGAFGAQFLNVQENAEVVLQGPLTLVLDGLQVAAGAELVFDTTLGEIELYVSNALVLDPAAVLTNSAADATQVTINVAGAATVSLAAADAFHGLVYAPDAAVSVGAGFELFGGLVAEALVLADGATLHHDRALIEAGAAEALPKLLSWRIIELPEGSPDTVNVDPFALLGVDPTTCPPPRDAHEDQLISLIYVDSTLATQTYDGLESAFNWGDVRQVVMIQRQGGLVKEDLMRLARDGSLGFTVP